MERERRREHERDLYGRSMQDQHGAPEDCQLLPYDCVLLVQSIRAAGNEPPAWILSAARCWLAANNLSERDIAPGNTSLRTNDTGDHGGQ